MASSHKSMSRRRSSRRSALIFRPIKSSGPPTLAYEALKLENKVGTMLPYNVVVRDAGSGRTEVAAIDPVASMRAIDNPELMRAAENVREKLQKMINEL